MRSSLLFFSTLLLSITGAHACVSKFNDCSATRTCPPSASGGSGSITEGSGGSAGAGGESAGGESAGGESAGGEGAGAPEAGAGGVGIDGRCSVNGALACQGAAQRLTLICRQGVWQPNVTCDSDENCEQSTGACAKIVESCRERAAGSPFCEGDTLVECGVDLVSVTETECAGVCAELDGAAACREPLCSDGKVEAPEQCDDGNDESGDGCSKSCTWEVRSIVAGANHTCALSEGGTVKCWGVNLHGELGLGDNRARGDEAGELGEALPAVDLGEGRLAKAIFAGFAGTCALLTDDSLKCWGDNAYGQLGLGDTAARGDQPGEMGDKLPVVELGKGRVARSVAMSAVSACAVLDNGALKCWGKSDAGQLGLGDTQQRGDGADEMGDALAAVNLGTGRWAKAVSVGQTHACAVLDDDTVKCWGKNHAGQLGLGDLAARGDEPDEMGNRLPVVDLGPQRRVLGVKVSIGDTFYMDMLGRLPFSCATLSDDSLACWGWVKHLGLSTTNIGDMPEELGSALPTLPLGLRRRVQTFEAGILHVCAILDDRSVKCWGNNDYGQAGGAVEAGESPAPIDLGAGEVAIGLAVGASHSCVLLRSRAVKCWGNNDSGQLGLGDVRPRGVNPGELGDALPAVELSF